MKIYIIIIALSLSFLSITLAQPTLYGDINGDGIPDKVFFETNRVTVELGKLTGGFDNPRDAKAIEFTASRTWNLQQHVRTLGDVNNDGRADLVGFGNDAVYVAFGKTDGTFDNFRVALANRQFTIQGTWQTHLHHRWVEDINTDGCADIIGIGNARSVWHSLCNGLFTAATLINYDNTNNFDLVMVKENLNIIHNNAKIKANYLINTSHKNITVEVQVITHPNCDESPRRVENIVYNLGPQDRIYLGNDIYICPDTSKIQICNYTIVKTLK